MFGLSKRDSVFTMIVVFVSIGLLFCQNTAAQPPCNVEDPECFATIYGPYSDGNCVGIVMDIVCGEVTWCGVPIPGTATSGTCAASACGSGTEIVITCSQ
jgi:hypothetical protein